MITSHENLSEDSVSVRVFSSFISRRTRQDRDGIYCINIYLYIYGSCDDDNIRF